MTGPNQELLRATLRSIRLPDGTEVTSRIDSLDVRDGLVHLALRIDRAEAAAMEPVRRAAQALLARQPGVMNATVVLTSHRAEPKPTAPPPAAREPATRPRLLADVPHVVAVASGKGGVGKSTVATNLAVALARSGRRVGLLDADVHGPSLPRMLGINAKPELRAGRMVPPIAWGVHVMSMGMLVDQDTAMIWRGPMVMGALEQLMGQSDWPPLDVMLVDMPPGTGDAQLTMAQRVNLSGAVVVSTPQDVALIDARRGVRMFEKTMVPVLGLVENMSTFCCPNCGQETPLFGHGGARREAEALGVPFLGEVPLLLDIRTSGDEGAPVAAADGPAGQAFAAIAARVWTALEAPKPRAPRIVVA